MQRKEADCKPVNEDLVKKIKKNMPITEDDYYYFEIAEFFKGMSDITRVKILYVLSRNEKLCVNDIANLVECSKSAVSHQLALLKTTSHVKGEKIGKEVYYSLDDEHVKGVFDLGIEHVDHKLSEGKYLIKNNKK